MAMDNSRHFAGGYDSPDATRDDDIVVAQALRH